ELVPVREAELEPNPRALPTRQELAARLDDPALTLLDVRREEEYTGKRGSACDPRQGHIPGARRVQVDSLFDDEGRPLPPERIRELVGAPEGAEVVAYCHSGSRSEARATTRATTRGRGTSGRGIPSCRSSARTPAGGRRRSRGRGRVSRGHARCLAPGVSRQDRSWCLAPAVSREDVSWCLAPGVSGEDRSWCLAPGMSRVVEVSRLAER